MYDIKRYKSELREEYLNKRRAIPADLKRELDKKICANILNSVSYKYYDTVLLFAALPDEPDLSAVAVKALADGKRVAYPRCIPGSRDMRFHYITGLSQLIRGSYNISEPDEAYPVFDTDSPSCSLCCVPAVAVDGQGYRVGYGGGYYDRFLSVYNGASAAVVYSDFIIQSVPHGKYDKKADMIITEGGIIRIV